MNSARIKRALLPLIVVTSFICISYYVASILDKREWGNILMLGFFELSCLYVVSKIDMNLNRKRFLCCILALQFVFFTAVYSVVTWFFINFNVAVIDELQLFMYETYGPVSAATSIALIFVSVCPKGLLNGFAELVRVEFYINRINNFFGLCLFSIEKGTQR